MKWERIDGVLELQLDRPPCNEIGSAALEELEGFVKELPDARAVVIHSTVEAGFCAGADLRELYRRGLELAPGERAARVGEFLDRIHAVLDALDTAPACTVAAVHGICFGGGFELALACDLIVADTSARFAFPELRLGLVPGFGGLPRLDRETSNALVRDLLLTGRSVNAARARQAGFVSQVLGEGHALRAARATAAQAAKFDPETVRRAKAFAKPIPRAALDEEKRLFLELFGRPVVQEALKRFVESDDDPMPYLP